MMAKLVSAPSLIGSSGCWTTSSQCLRSVASLLLTRKKAKKARTRSQRARREAESNLLGLLGLFLPFDDRFDRRANVKTAELLPLLKELLPRYQVLCVSFAFWLCFVHISPLHMYTQLSTYFSLLLPFLSLILLMSFIATWLFYEFA